MKTMGDVVAEPARDELWQRCDIGMVRRASLESLDRLSLSSGSSSVLSAGSEIRTKTIRSLKRGLGKLWKRHRGNASITEYDPTYKVAYLGNVLTGWAKGEGCVEKPVSTLWRNYVGSNRPDVSMRLTVTSGGLTATTKDHGLTEYWAHRVTYCTAPASHPRLFVWVYRHEGRRLRPELRCHAALCSKESTARRLASVLNARLHQALLEFRRDKVSRQNARLSLANAVYENPSLPRRKLLLSTGGSNYRPPLERSKSAPKLSAIEEDAVAEEIEQQRFLEELRSLERGWHADWRLASLLDALHRQPHDSSDENASISSGCETASTANSEERVSSGDDSHLALHHPEIDNGERTTGSERGESETSSGLSSPGPRRNSDGSPNFMTCAGSPRFRRRRPRSRGSRPHQQQSSRAEADESMGEEEMQAPEPPCDYFDYEDADELEHIVDFRPHGESPTASGQSAARLQSDNYAQQRAARRDDVIKLMSSRRSCGPKGDELDGSDGQPSFHALGSLHEEEAAADSDESGYVEATPCKPLAAEQAQQDEAPQFIKCPISETIRKLANASLRSSRPQMRLAGGCDDAESPSLLQRKRLLAQHGVTV